METTGYGRKQNKLEGKYVFRWVCGILQTAAAALSFWYVWILYTTEHNQTRHLTGTANRLMALMIYAAVLVLFMRSLGGYKIGVNRKMNVVASITVSLFLTDAIEVFISLAITGQFRFFFDFLWRYIVLFLVQAVVIDISGILLTDLYRKIFPPLRLIEIYGEHPNRVAKKMGFRDDKYVFGGKISCEKSDAEIVEAILPFDAVLLNDIPAEREDELLRLCFDRNMRVYFTPQLSDVMIKSSDDINLFDTPIYLCRNNGMSAWQRFWKRFFDILLSAVATIVLSPLLGIVALLIKLEDGGPVFYRQERVTLNGRHFMILKFRSMIVDAEKDNRSIPAGAEDPRITKIGKFIRATRIDELPQLFNILRGDMSIVGPRPERVSHVEKYTSDIPEFRFRLKMRGGLTGYAQVYGKYNTTAIDKLKMDLIYIANYSLLLDVQIIFETLRVLMQKESTEGFSADAQKVMHDADQAGTGSTGDSIQTPDGFVTGVVDGK